MGMTIKQLEYVIAVVKHGSLSQAAANLYISQPTLSEGLQNLEEELGFPIFQRRHSGMVLTPEGPPSRRTPRRCWSRSATSTSATASIRSGGSPSPSAPPIFTAWSPPLPSSPRRSAGSTPCGCWTAGSWTPSRRWPAGVSELGFTSYTEENYNYTARKLKSMDLEFQEVCTLKPMVFLSEKHPLARRKSLRTDDLKGYPCITFYQGPTTPRYFEEEMFLLPEWERELVIQDNGAATIFLLETDGFSIGSGILPRSLRDVGLCTVPLADVPPSTVIWVKRKNHILSEAAKRFMELCERELFSEIAVKNG